MSLYSWFHSRHLLVNLIFVCTIFFTIWNTLKDILLKKVKYFFKITTQPHLSGYIINKFPDEFLNQQVLLLISVIFVNVFGTIVYDDYYLSSLYLSLTTIFTQILSLIYIFISKESKKPITHQKISFTLGLISIILAFTYIYFFLYVNFRSGFDNFQLSGMGGKPLEDWMNCLFYSISLIIPYSLTELSPNTYWMKSISLFQIIIFYVFIFKKLRQIFSQSEK